MFWNLCKYLHNRVGKGVAIEAMGFLTLIGIGCTSAACFHPQYFTEIFAGFCAISLLIMGVVFLAALPGIVDATRRPQ